MRGGCVLIIAGGTGGHVFPGLAVAERLKARGVPVVWLGSRQGIENRLVPQAGIELRTIAVSGLRGKGGLALLLAPFRLLRALFQALREVRACRPLAVLSFGGFAAGPGSLAAWLLRLPLIVHEQNRVPGVTNRILARRARRVLTGFPDSFPAGLRTEHVGNPVREAIAAVPAPHARMVGREGRARLLVLGGSQGAMALNREVPAALALLAEHARPQVIHQCGARHVEACRAAYAQAGVEACIEPFLADMAKAYAWADLVLCRSGALTLAELAAAGVAALLVPYPHAVDDHQTRNAEYFVESGAAQILPEREISADSLAPVLAALLDNRPRLLAMAEAARSLARVDAADRVADACLEEAA
ncbi:MAG TPA: undecaprenyldiphospho-muramoylpentapeptide beta-N-acetylglucosaminyltransferase [Xanthomonadaceae bacterium]|nr:undecaprenyldiphospho-muramoylpentapeptide beta-N-acetylglucosaminyltransferase [Xanthomonadaceae bacterium]